MNPSKTRSGMLAALMASIGVLMPAAVPFASIHSTKHKRNGRGKAGAYGRGLQNAWNRKRLQQQKKLNHLRDEHGAYTLVGRNPFTPRRKWLAGISAIRGY